jgi:glycerophosphoryl diester phosphodiesterase
MKQLGMAQIACVLSLLWLPAGAFSQDAPKLFCIDAKSPEGLQELFHYDKQPLPLVSAHRGGGAMAGFPENCIPTFEHTLQHGYAMLEIDPRYTKDGQIVVIHDDTLDRTTTGKGRVKDFSLAELKQLKLKDAAGKVTDFEIPTLDEVLEWAREKTIVVLDQKDVPTASRVKAIEQQHAEAHAMLIVNSFKDAKAAYEANPKIILEVMVPNRAKVAEFDELGVPWKNVIAFVGHVPPEDLELYRMIHERGACCMIGTSRNLDKQFLGKTPPDLQQLEQEYRAFLARGADLIETDTPVPLEAMLFGNEPKLPEGKARFFSQ